MIIDLLWLISGVLWLPLYVAIHLILRRDPKWLRWWGNRVDNLPDALTQFLHCHKIPFTGEPGWQLNISFLMKNRKTSWDIIRKYKYYANCDPEDKP
jgi:hypothetical protein